MLENQKQQHLRSLRRGLNRAVATLRDGGSVIAHTGWCYGRAFLSPWLSNREKASFPLVDDKETFLLFPPLKAFDSSDWAAALIPEELAPALSFFWPGPLHVRVPLATEQVKKSDQVRRTNLMLACPWHPLMQELLSRQGPLLWSPLSELDAQCIQDSGKLSGAMDKKERLLIWPEPEVKLEPTKLDVVSKTWRLVQEGFVSASELQRVSGKTLLLSEERAFPARAIQTYLPEGKTIVVESKEKELLPRAITALRGQVPPDSYIRIYLDECTAHHHFPDDREVRVYGELSDLERVRRRLQAMLERQNRRLGKRVLLIGIAELAVGNESFRMDLEKLSDGWIFIEKGVEPKIDVFL